MLDIKLLAEKEEMRKKEVEEEQRRQDEWMEELLRHRAADKRQGWVAGYDKQGERLKAAIEKGLRRGR